MIEHGRILVVDDEPQITRVLRRSLATRGYEVQVAADGEEALDLFRHWAPDLVITDLSMPHIGGLELCRRLRTISPVPIIVLSVKGEEWIKVEALDAGADDYVTKPFGMAELFARVRAALRRALAVPGSVTSLLETGDFRRRPGRPPDHRTGSGGASDAEGIRPAGIPDPPCRESAHASHSAGGYLGW